ncbi:MAG: hypothetical protein ACMUIS_05115 [bacterium]
MMRHDRELAVLLCVLFLCLVFGMCGSSFAQYPYPFNPFFTYNPYYYPYLSLPFAPYPLIPTSPFPASPLISALSLPAPRIGAATIIVTNPTAGTVSVLNPTVASAPVLNTAVTASPPPLLSILGIIYTSALYEGALSTENPLIFALLQNLFL